MNDVSFRLDVLKKNIIGKEFTNGKWSEEGDLETKLTYLGSIKTTKGKVYKIMNYVFIWGRSGRSTNRILVFNEKNTYLGNYNITTSSNLPTEIINGQLLFKNTDKDCDKKISTMVNFNKGIPKSFFRKCTLEFGDTYIFE
jgi:hypothetical protein